jgi:hypothetical protein
MLAVDPHAVLDRVWPAELLFDNVDLEDAK